MGEVMIVYRILPSDVNVYEKMKETVLKTAPEVLSHGEEPIAFGLKALKIKIIVKDAEGGPEAFEEKLRAIPEVGEFEAVDMDRL